MKNKIFFLTFCASFVCSNLWAQQIADTAYTFPNPKPKYAAGKGRVVWVDAAHHNFHTLDGRYAPFGKLLQGDGYQVVSNTEGFSSQTIDDCRILVISNALDSSNTSQWRLPNPSAFRDGELTVLLHWVGAGGGRLLLIADHMPFAGAAQELADLFGFKFVNCFAMDNRRRRFERFYRSNQSLADNEITRGVDTVVTFTGSAFTIPRGATPILALKNYTLSSPEVAWQFEENTPTIDGEGYYQGAYMDYGRGKIVVMGEAAMFTAQLSGPNRTPTGLNVPEARQNGQLLLNIIHWLDE